MFPELPHAEGGNGATESAGPFIIGDVSGEIDTRSERPLLGEEQIRQELATAEAELELQPGDIQRTLIEHNIRELQYMLELIKDSGGSD